MRDRLAGVGVGHATGDGPGGLQCELNGFAAEAASVLISMTWLANRGSRTLKKTRSPGPTPCRVNRPSAPVIAGLGQPGKSSG